jgi:hypothetical protein
MPGGNGENSQHWSADFVQHIRTVHFSLVAVCVALIGAVVSVKPKEITAAMTQLSEIRSAVDHWGEEVKIAVLGGIVRHTVDGKRIVVKGKPVMLSKDAAFSGEPSTPSKKTLLEKLEESFETPASLPAFCNTWDMLNNVPKLIIPDQSQVVKTVVAVNNGSSSIAQYQSGDETTSTTVLVSSLAAPDHDAISRLHLATLDSAASKYAYSWDVGDDHIIVPVAASEWQIDGQGAINRAARKTWKTGACGETFRALIRQTSDSTDQSFGGLAAYLAQAAAKEKTDSYTVFGMEFPVESASRWGILLIVGILLYLWIHLNEVSSRIKHDDPGWDVAWIGVYRSLPARSLFIFLTVVLPLVTIFILSNALITADPVLGAIYAYTAGIASLILSVLIVRWAPQHWDRDPPPASDPSLTSE